ncbi:dihydrofolate reductase [Priestia aryabhattai]|nr:dihydrofolate reductase [Priestia aryabhattai]
MVISFIFAMDKNRLIGKGNSLPWHLPADLKFFKQVTTGHPVVMGRKTHESIGKPLPGRENIILTRNISYDAKGCTVLNSISAIEEMGKKEKKEIFIIGGAEIYKLAFPIADRLYITTIDEEFEGDTYFPEFNESEWRLVSREKGLKDEKNPYDYYFTIYERNE